MPPLAFEPIYPNPYIAGNPVRSREMFFGREDEFNFIARALEEGRKTALIVLFGERRSGKSSILYQILNGRLGEAFLPFFIDTQIMAGITGDAEFFSRIIADFCKQLPSNALPVERYLTMITESTATNVFREFLQDLKSRFPGRALLVLIDEYENLEGKIKMGSLSRYLPTFFAGLLETELVSFVFTGSKNLQHQEGGLWGEVLLRRATPHKISFLTKDDTVRLIVQPLQGKASFAPEAIAEIYLLTAGQPFYTQMICQNLVYHLNETHKCEVRVQDVHNVVASMLADPPPQLLFNWGEHFSERKLALSALAEFSPKSETLLSARELRRSLEREKLGFALEENFFNTELSSLAQDEYLVQKDRHYGFRFDLYRQWVRHDHNIWQVQKEIGPAKLARITKKAYLEKEKKQRRFRFVERSLAAGLAALAIFLAFKFFVAIQREVIVQANGGPFEVWVDDEKHGTTRGRPDSLEYKISTRFGILAGLTKGREYFFKVKLLNSEAAWQDTVIIKNQDNVVKPEFPTYPVEVITDAASVVIQLGGISTHTEEDQPEAWYHTFQVCAGRYLLWVKDRRTGVTWRDTITVPLAANPVRVDFDTLVTLQLKANVYRFEYWPTREEENKKQVDSALVLRGQPKGSYNFTFHNPRTGEKISQNLQLTADMSFEIPFNPKWKPPSTGGPSVASASAVTSPPIQYTLRIESNPSGARIYLNDEDRGVTPFIETLAADRYWVRIEEDGYDSAIENISLSRNDTILVHLTPRYGFLKLVVQNEQRQSLPDVKVFVDDRLEDETTPRLKELRLLARKYKLRFERVGYTTVDTLCIISKENQTPPLTITMKRSR